MIDSFQWNEKVPIQIYVPESKGYNRGHEMESIVSNTNGAWLSMKLTIMDQSFVHFVS